MNRLARLSIASVFVFGLAFRIQGSLTTQANSVSVPFVGCKSDGQAGPFEAPKTAKVQTRLDRTLAARLTLYKAEYGSAVLGPRGWSCIGIYGSGGGALYITPVPIAIDNIFDSKWEGITGPGIEATGLIGGTSGRFRVAQIVARVFPAYRSFVEKIIAEGIEPVSNFPFGPFPTDKMTYLTGGKAVEYETPPRMYGLGTFSRLRQNNDLIRGVVTLDGDEPDVTVLALRLPQNLNDLTPIIIKQFEVAH